MVAEVAGSLRVVMGGCGRGVEKGTPLARSLAHTANEISKSKRLSCDLQFSLRGGDKRENISIRREPRPPQQSFYFFFASLESAVQKDKPIQAGLHFVCKHTGLI